MQFAQSGEYTNARETPSNVKYCIYIYMYVQNILERMHVSTNIAVTVGPSSYNVEII